MSIHSQKNRAYYEAHKEQKKEYARNYYHLKRQQFLALAKEKGWSQTWPDINKYKQKNYFEKKPWIRQLYLTRQRCHNPSHPSYKYYGALGATCTLTLGQTQDLWFHYRANEMAAPILIRIDETQPYSYDNCLFIDKSLKKPLDTTTPESYTHSVNDL